MFAIFVGTSALKIRVISPFHPVPIPSIIGLSPGHVRFRPHRAHSMSVLGVAAFLGVQLETKAVGGVLGCFLVRINGVHPGK